MKIGSREYKEWLDSPLTKALKSSFEQSVTDPENQPSQYGTVTLAMYELVCKQRDLARALRSTCKTNRNDLLRRNRGSYQRHQRKRGEMMPAPPLC